MSKAKFTSVSATSFEFNGKIYSSLDEMPPEIRRLFEDVMSKLRADRDGNGIPDILEDPPANSAESKVIILPATESEFSKLSPEMRRRYEEMLAKHRDGTSGGIALKDPVVIERVKHIVSVDGKEIDVTNLPTESRGAVFHSLGATRSEPRNPWLYIGIAIGVLGTILFTRFLSK